MGSQIIISRRLSVCLCPKAIPLSSLHSIVILMFKVRQYRCLDHVVGGELFYLTKVASHIQLDDHCADVNRSMPIDDEDFLPIKMIECNQNLSTMVWDYTEQVKLDIS